MKAAIWKGIERIDIEDIAIPEPRDNEILVKVKACGICGTDMHIYYGEMTYAKPPVVLGHEFAGTVEEVGNDVKDIRCGDMVSVDPNASCNHCYYCRNDMPNQCMHLKPYGVVKNGGFEEYCVISEVGAVGLRDRITAEQGAFIEPLSCVCHAFDKIKMKPTDTVSIDTVSVGFIFILSKAWHTQDNGSMNAPCSAVILSLNPTAPTSLMTQYSSNPPFFTTPYGFKCMHWFGMSFLQ